MAQVTWIGDKENFQQLVMLLKILNSLEKSLGQLEYEEKCPRPVTFRDHKYTGSICKLVPKLAESMHSIWIHRHHLYRQRKCRCHKFQQFGEKLKAAGVRREMPKTRNMYIPRPQVYRQHMQACSKTSRVHAQYLCLSSPSLSTKKIKTS